MTEYRLSTVPLRERVEVLIGRQRSPQHAQGRYVVPYLRAANVKDGHMILDDVLAMNFAPEEQEKFHLEDGDVLVTEGCGSLSQIGASAQWAEGMIAGTVCFQNTLLRLRAIPGRADPGFVNQWAKWSFESRAFARIATGTNIFHVGAKRSSEMPFPNISVEEQRRISDLLAHFDMYLLRQCDYRLRLLGLADSVRLLLHSVAKEAAPLRQFVVRDGIQIGPFGSQLHSSDYVEDGVPVVMPRDMNGGRIEASSAARIRDHDARRLARHTLLPGDILLPRRGNLKKRALVRESERGWICGTGSVRVRVPVEMSRLVFEALSTDEVSRWLTANAVGSTMPNLNTEIIGRLPLRLPDLDEAQPHLALLEEIEHLVSCLGEQIDAGHKAVKSIRASLMTREHVIPDDYDRIIGTEPLPLTALATA